MDTFGSEPEVRPADVVVFGAPGASCEDGLIRTSAAGLERAGLAARFWLSFDQTSSPMRMICVAGRPKYRSNMPPLRSGQSEAAEMTAIIRALGVPSEVIRPNDTFPLQRGYSTSTVDEVALLVEEGLIAPGMYGPDSPLAIVLHRRHAARAVALLRKVGFDKQQLRVVSPSTADSPTEVIIRVIY